MSELRIGVVAYSNTAPLTAGLPAGGMRRGLPCEVADWLAAGEVDVGLIPAIELARAPGVRGLPGWGIAADGPCLSVLLFGKVPLADVRSLTLDAASRTAAALTRVLLDREGCRDVRFVPMAGGTVAERLDGVDATLVIGDPALQAEVPGGVSRWDLAEEWKRHVGLPFVFATWASRAGLELSPAERAVFSDSAELGLSRLPQLAAAEAERTGLEPALLERYLGTLQYRLGVAHLRGLRAFLDEAERVGALAESQQVTFYEGEWS